MGQKDDYPHVHYAITEHYSCLTDVRPLHHSSVFVQVSEYSSVLKVVACLLHLSVIPAPGNCAITISSKEKNITAEVTKCDEEAGQKFLNVPVTKATARAAEHCNESV